MAGQLVALWHPEVLVPVLLVQGLYLYCAGPMRRRYRLGPPVSGARRVAFLLGMGLVYAAEGTPLHLLAEHYLFSAHMLQHVLLTLLMPPLVLLGTPGWMLRPLLAWRPVLAIARVLTHPVVTLLAFNVVYSIWHLPALYDAALWNHNVHILEHVMFVPTAVLMWWPLLSPVRELPRLADGLQVLYVFVLSVGQLAVTAGVGFAESVLYSRYAQAPRLWGLTPHADQQVAASIMNLAGMGVLLVTLVAVFLRWAAREARADATGPCPGQPPTR